MADGRSLWSQVAGLPIVGRAQVANERLVDRLLARRFFRRLDPLLGLSVLRRVNPLISLVPVVVLLVLGARTSQYGHMDTVGGIFPLMTVISALNPAVGFLSGVAYGVADLIQKFVTDDVFYEGARTSGDYWGARGGYLLAYSSLLLFGLAPGMLSRAGSLLARRGALQVAGRRANGAELSKKAELAVRIIGGAVGGAAGGVLGSVAFQGLSAPAFLLRPTPDHSCFDLAGQNASASIPGTGGAGGGTGGASSGAETLQREKVDEQACERARLEFRQRVAEYEHYQAMVAEVIDAEQRFEELNDVPGLIATANEAVEDGWRWLLVYYPLAWLPSLPYEFLKLLGGKVVAYSGALLSFGGAWSAGLVAGKRALLTSLIGLTKAKIALWSGICSVVSAALAPGAVADYTGLHAQAAAIRAGINRVTAETRRLQRAYDEARLRLEGLRNRYAQEPLSLDYQTKLYGEIQRAASQVGSACGGEVPPLPSPPSGLVPWPAVSR